MITDADIKKMKEVFTTKEDLKPLKKGIREINKKLDKTIVYNEQQLNYHHRRLVQLEDKNDLKPPSFIDPIPVN